MQVEATRSTNETLAKLFLMSSNKEVKDIAPLPLVLAPIAPPVATITSALQPSQIGPSTPNNFNGDQSKG
jgi:hypothetical protein